MSVPGAGDGPARQLAAELVSGDESVRSLVRVDSDHDIDDGLWHAGLLVLDTLGVAAAAVELTCLSRKTEPRSYEVTPGRFCGTRRATRQGTRHDRTGRAAKK
jgi:hypothetical protein